MDRKRKLPARASARSGLSKKRTSTPPEQAPIPVPAPVVEEALPKSIAGGKPLPTVEQPQPEDLPLSQYQSVAERWVVWQYLTGAQLISHSGVMAESLERSRKKWLSEGIFEKYWTKPSKKKIISAEEQANNPSKDSMSKLGPCTITIEPHVFDAMMYAVKDPNPRPPQQQPMYRPIIQYGPPQPHQLPPTPQSQHTHVQAGTPTPAQSTSNPVSAGTSQTPNGNFAPQQSPNNVVSAPVSQPAPKPPTNAAPSPAPAKSSDPVIQMLAERAATDQDLKALMRIVADGKATAEELKKFQAHIDELTKMLHARQAATAPPPSPAHLPAPNTARPPPAVAANSRTPQASPVTNGGPQYAVQPQPQALRSKGPVPQSKPDITAVVFEFIGGSGDRYLFPKYSILDYHPGGQVIASFLIVRKGSGAESKKYDPALDYYQPITIRLYTHQGRQLDSLAKVVAPQDEVRKYMDDIMDNMTRAEYVLLAMRLPREVEQPAEEEDTPAQVQQPSNQVLWTTSANPPQPIKQKPVKKPLTEGEQYQTFITSIASN